MFYSIRLCFIISLILMGRSNGGRHFFLLFSTRIIYKFHRSKVTLKRIIWKKNMKRIQAKYDGEQRNSR